MLTSPNKGPVIIVLTSTSKGPVVINLAHFTEQRPSGILLISPRKGKWITACAQFTEQRFNSSGNCSIALTSPSKDPEL